MAYRLIQAGVDIRVEMVVSVRHRSALSDALRPAPKSRTSLPANLVFRFGATVVSSRLVTHQGIVSRCGNCHDGSMLAGTDESPGEYFTKTASAVIVVWDHQP
jgi:hypothetical protein